MDRHPGGYPGPTSPLDRPRTPPPPGGHGGRSHHAGGSAYAGPQSGSAGYDAPRRPPSSWDHGNPIMSAPPSMVPRNAPMQGGGGGGNGNRSSRPGGGGPPYSPTTGAPSMGSRDLPPVSGGRAGSPPVGGNGRDFFPGPLSSSRPPPPPPPPSMLHGSPPPPPPPASAGSRSPTHARHSNDPYGPPDQQQQQQHWQRSATVGPIPSGGGGGGGGGGPPPVGRMPTQHQSYNHQHGSQQQQQQQYQYQHQQQQQQQHHHLPPGGPPSPNTGYRAPSEGARRPPSDSLGAPPRGDPMSMSSILSGGSGGSGGGGGGGPGSGASSRLTPPDERKMGPPSGHRSPPPHQQSRADAGPGPGSGGNGSGGNGNGNGNGSRETSVAASLARRKWSGPIAEEAERQAAAWRAQEQNRFMAGHHRARSGGGGGDPAAVVGLPAPSGAVPSRKAHSSQSSRNATPGQAASGPTSAPAAATAGEVKKRKRETPPEHRQQQQQPQQQPPPPPPGGMPRGERDYYEEERRMRAQQQQQQQQQGRSGPASRDLSPVGRGDMRDPRDARGPLPGGRAPPPGPPGYGNNMGPPPPVGQPGGYGPYPPYQGGPYEGMPAPVRVKEEMYGPPPPDPRMGSVSQPPDMPMYAGAGSPSDPYRQAPIEQAPPRAPRPDKRARAAEREAAQAASASGRAPPIEAVQYDPRSGAPLPGSGPGPLAGAATPAPYGPMDPAASQGAPGYPAAAGSVAPQQSFPAAPADAPPPVPRDLNAGPRVDSEPVWEHLERCERVEADRRLSEVINAKAQQERDAEARRAESKEETSGASSMQALNDVINGEATPGLGLGRGRPVNHLGTWFYDPLVDPLIHGELLAVNIGATLEVRISGERLGPGPSIAEMQREYDASAAGSEQQQQQTDAQWAKTVGRWRLGWRGREHARMTREMRAALSAAGPHAAGAAASPARKIGAAVLASSEANAAGRAAAAATDGNNNRDDNSERRRVSATDAAWAFRGLRPLAKRKLWGTDVYTDDSDVLAMCVHAGWVELPAFPPGEVAEWVPSGFATEQWKKMQDPEAVAEKKRKLRQEQHRRQANGGAADQDGDARMDDAGGNSELASGNDVMIDVPLRSCDLSVVLRIAPRLIAYKGCHRAGLMSRSWGNTHDGVSLVVESVELREVRTARVDRYSEVVEWFTMLTSIPYFATYSLATHSLVDARR